MLGLGVSVGIVLWLWLQKTRTGMVIRAGVDDRQMTSMEDQIVLQRDGQQQSRIR